ncbi:MAG: chemotaxis protein CheB [Bacteroidota bacterium]
MNKKVILIGGSAGSFQIVLQLLASLPGNYPHAVILCLHRLKSVKTGFVEALSLKSKMPVVEPYDKEAVLPGYIYLSPSNYHLLIEKAEIFSFSTEEPKNHSRPSIDLALTSASIVFRERLIGVILSGANCDGAEGLAETIKNGGIGLVQDPKDCQVDTMTGAAIERSQNAFIMNSSQIIDYICKI